MREKWTTVVTGRRKRKSTDETVADWITVGRVIKTTSSTARDASRIIDVVAKTVASNKNSITAAQSRGADALIHKFTNKSIK